MPLYLYVVTDINSVCVEIQMHLICMKWGGTNTKPLILRIQKMIGFRLREMWFWFTWDGTKRGENSRITLHFRKKADRGIGHDSAFRTSYVKEPWPWGFSLVLTSKGFDMNENTHKMNTVPPPKQNAPNAPSKVHETKSKTAAQKQAAEPQPREKILQRKPPKNKRSERFPP